MVDITDKAKSICESNYAKNCGGCPLRPKCVTSIGPGYDGFYKWVNGVNQLANEIEERGSIEG